MFEFNPLDLEMTVKLLMAVFLGGIVGLERELNRSVAGIKTYAIVCMGATLFTLAAKTIDIGITTGVITGVGFLGAAMVFKSDNKVFGLTTAALIWATSAIGLSIGLGLYLGGVVATVLLMVLLIPVKRFEEKVLKAHSKQGFKTKDKENSAVTF